MNIREIEMVAKDTSFQKAKGQEYLTDYKAAQFIAWG